jgi:hypothetical protein
MNTTAKIVILAFASLSSLLAMERSQESAQSLRAVYFLFDNELISIQFQKSAIREQLRARGVDAQFLPVESTMPERITKIVDNLVKANKVVISVRWADAYDMGHSTVADPLDKLVKRCPLKLVLAQSSELMQVLRIFPLDYSTLVFRDEQRTAFTLTDAPMLAHMLSIHSAQNILQ